jgi:hypothetical protein
MTNITVDIIPTQLELPFSKYKSCSNTLLERSRKIAGDPGSIPGRNMFVVGCSGRGWREHWSSFSVVSLYGTT